MEFKFKLRNRPRSLLEHGTSYSCCALVGRLVKTEDYYVVVYGCSEYYYMYFSFVHSSLTSEIMHRIE